MINNEEINRDYSSKENRYRNQMAFKGGTSSHASNFIQ